MNVGRVAWAGGGVLLAVVAVLAGHGVGYSPAPVPPPAPVIPAESYLDHDAVYLEGVTAFRLDNTTGADIQVGRGRVQGNYTVNTNCPRILAPGAFCNFNVQPGPNAASGWLMVQVNGKLLAVPLYPYTTNQGVTP